MGAPNTLRRTSKPGRQHRGGCDWCGQTPRILFSYGHDGHAFCNLACVQAFWGYDLDYDYLDYQGAT